MAASNSNTNWEKIQQGVKEVEKLIGQKDYNGAMVKARQTLEFMVKLQAARAGIAETSELKNLIDTLYQNHWISKATCEHYHKIRIIGNKAVHEGDTNAYNANQSYHALSQEVYTFANDYKNARRGTRQSSARRQSSAKSSSKGAATTRSRKRRQAKGLSFTVYDLLKLLIPILCIILLFVVVKLVKPDSDSKETTANVAAETQVEKETVPEETAPQETEEAAPSVVYRTTAVLNVRSEPSTDGSRVGQLEAGATVDYVEAYDDDWAVIQYNGSEAYVASSYLTTE
ncbi:MAG: SH3 domain-containing protein [Clostridiales bacterium]|nr:SH3 domain-containing protein [Clostridiales bacterium]